MALQRGSSKVDDTANDTGISAMDARRTSAACYLKFESGCKRGVRTRREEHLNARGLTKLVRSFELRTNKMICRGGNHSMRATAPANTDLRALNLLCSVQDRTSLRPRVVTERPAMDLKSSTGLNGGVWAGSYLRRRADVSSSKKISLCGRSPLHDLAQRRG